MFDFQEFEAILHDGELFINHTIEELEYLLVENLDETLKNFNDTLTQIESEFDELKNSLIQEISPLNDTAHEFLDLVRQFNQAAVNISEMNNIKEGLTTDIDTVLSQLPKRREAVCAVTQHSQHIVTLTLFDLRFKEAMSIICPWR